MMREELPVEHPADPTYFNPTRSLGPTCLGPTRLGLARLGPTRPDPTRLGPTRLLNPMVPFRSGNHYF